MVRRAKLTQEMVDEAIRLKADGLSNGDIICALGIHESTFYCWIGDPKNKLQRALSEGLKKEYAAFKRTLLTTIRSAAPRIVLGVVAQPVQEKLPGFDDEGRSDG